MSEQEKTKTKPAHGTFCWNELMTRDKAAAGKFYSELIGWEAKPSDMPGMEYTVFKTGDKEAGGMMNMPEDIPAEVPSHWVAYITVDDVDACAAKVKGLGGEIVHGPVDMPEVGKFMFVKDPTGAVVGLITLASK